MNHIKTFEKYQHTKQDLIDDMTYINEFSKKFEDLFEARLNLTASSDAHFINSVGYGAKKNYTGNTILNNTKILSNKVKIEYVVYIKTDINPNGITSEDDINRTYVIRFDIIKNKSRNVNSIPSFYAYSINMNETIYKFDNYISNKLGIRNLTEEEIKEFKIKKDAKKYNL